MTDLRPFTFDVRTPGARDEIDARMADRDAQAHQEACPLKTCVIVGNGPSARSGALWRRLDRLMPGEMTVACNGALKLFTDQGRIPHIWVCCDPQELVNDFIPVDPPRPTLYCLASKCPPSLFERLKDRHVAVFRLDDMRRTPGLLHLPSAVSVTLVAQSLMRLRGFHRFEMYGWDCCYLGGEHHATPQADVGERMGFEIQSQDGSVLHAFESCPAWTAELRDATLQTYNLKAMGYEVTVDGPGAVAALLRAEKLIA